MTYGYRTDAACSNHFLGIFWFPFSVLIKERRQKRNVLIVMFVMILKPSYRRIFGDKKNAQYLCYFLGMHLWPSRQEKNYPRPVKNQGIIFWDRENWIYVLIGWFDAIIAGRNMWTGGWSQDSLESKEVEDASSWGVKINLSHACETKWKGLFERRVILTRD